MTSASRLEQDLLRLADEHRASARYHAERARLTRAIDRVDRARADNAVPLRRRGERE